MACFVAVTDENIEAAARIHAASWQESHRSFCTKEFVAQHTPERQKRYLQEESAAGKQIWLLQENGEYVGLVSVAGGLIENLYVHPVRQRQGYGTMLLRFATAKCKDTPTLWILDNNDGAKRLYERNGFVLTGKQNRLTDTLCEMEMALPEMERHAMMEKELFSAASLDALAYLIDAGRELDFSCCGVPGFISCSGSKRCVSVWMEQKEQSFDSVMELFDHAMICGKAFRLSWDEMKIETLF
ncbi:MAG: GNAT family N-acetyltransferase [Clostridia bacterium]|nr:GNAT family N-acetyltransferase [Clostridia bacterium]